MGWLFGLLKGYGIESENLDDAFEKYEQLKETGKLSAKDLQIFEERTKQSQQGKDRKSQAEADDKTSIKEQVQDSKDKLKDTKVLAVIPKGKIVTDYRIAASTLQAKLGKNNGTVTREGIGEIQVSTMLKKARAYIKTPAEIAALSAVPTIIKNGIEIATHEKHKGRDYSTRTIAGKIKIAGQDGVLAVVIAKTNDNKYKVHRILTPDGKTLVIEKPPIN